MVKFEQGQAAFITGAAGGIGMSASFMANWARLEPAVLRVRGF